MSDNQVPFPFPRTLNVRQWEDYLGRRTTDEEYSLIESVKDERNYNKDLDKLFEITKMKGLYIPKLTLRNGNCLFESLNILGFCESQDDFRIFLAYMMYVFRNKKSFFEFENDSRSLKEMFNDMNEVEHVLCNEELIVYKYTYETMCQDFSSGFSWTRLPTQLIIQVISKLMNIRFEIYSIIKKKEYTSNESAYSEYIYVVDVNPTDSCPHVVYLGNMGEKHYVPLRVKTGKPAEDDCPKYNSARKFFFEWAIAMEQSINEPLMSDLPQQKKDLHRNTQEGYVEITNPINSSDNRVEYE